MKHQNGSIKGIRNTNIYYQYWLPEGESKAVLLIVHGLAEHSGRYMNVVNYFVPMGFAVYGMDHIGHGKSGGTRLYVKRFEDFTDTLKRCFDMVRNWQPEKPIFLLGHSMGGLIGAAYLLDYQAELKGAIISGPVVKVRDTISPTAILMGKVISALMPKRGLIKLEAGGVSRDPAVVKAYISDPLVCHGKSTARLSAELVKTIQRVTVEANKITLPILILQGSADKLVDPRGARMLFDTVSSTDKTIKIYNGLYHEVYNEPEHNQVLGEVKAWLETYLSARS